MSDKALVTIN